MHPVCRLRTTAVKSGILMHSCGKAMIKPMPAMPSWESLLAWQQCLSGPLNTVAPAYAWTLFWETRREALCALK